MAKRRVRRFFPSVAALQSLRAKSTQKPVLVEHWWMPEHRPEGRIQPTYGWAVARVAAYGTGDVSVEHFVNWKIVESMTLAQLRHEGKAHKDVVGLLSQSDKCVAVASFGEQWLSIHVFSTNPESSDSLLQLERCIGPALARNPAIGISMEYDGPPLDFFFTVSIPLEFLEPEVRVRRIAEGGKTKALVLGFVPEQRAIKGGAIDGVGGPPHAICIGATDDEPEALEQLEYFLDSYKHVYETYVKPAIGEPMMLTPRAHHSFMTHDKWKSLVADAMPEYMDDNVGVPNGRLRSGIREAIVACHGEVDESSWHDCLQGNPDDPTEVT